MRPRPEPVGRRADGEDDNSCRGGKCVYEEGQTLYVVDIGRSMYTWHFFFFLSDVFATTRLPTPLSHSQFQLGSSPQHSFHTIVERVLGAVQQDVWSSLPRPPRPPLPPPVPVAGPVTPTALPQPPPTPPPPPHTDTVTTFATFLRACLRTTAPSSPLLSPPQARQCTARRYRGGRGRAPPFVRRFPPPFLPFRDATPPG